MTLPPLPAPTTPVLLDPDTPSTVVIRHINPRALRGAGARGTPECARAMLRGDEITNEMQYVTCPECRALLVTYLRAKPVR